MSKRQTFSISFYCRASKTDKKGFAPVELSLVINGARTYIKLQRKERPDEFKKAMESKRDNDIKIYCENQRIRVNSIVEEMEFADIELTSENLKTCFKRGGVANYYNLGQLWNDLIENKRSEMKTGDIELDTYRRYDVAKKAFYAANGFTDDTPAKNVELQHIHKFQAYLRDDLQMEQCTAYNYHARCKTAFTLAFNRGKIKANPYAAFKMDKGGSKDIVYLSDRELGIIKKKPLIGRLDKVRDLFLFQCYSGLAYSDMALLQKEDYIINNKGQVFIQKKRKKTGQLFKSVVLANGIEILEKYQFQLPLISNVKMNAYLKEIQDICKIDKPLHTHLGRTTYICYLYNNGVPESTIAEIVGHSTCKTTLKYYAKMDNSSILKTLDEKGISTKKMSMKDNFTLDAVRFYLNNLKDSVDKKEASEIAVTYLQKYKTYQQAVVKVWEDVKDDKASGI